MRGPFDDERAARAWLALAAASAHLLTRDRALIVVELAVSVRVEAVQHALAHAGASLGALVLAELPVAIRVEALEHALAPLGSLARRRIAAQRQQSQAESQHQEGHEGRELKHR